MSELEPGSTIGIIDQGQLGRMMIEDSRDLGFNFYTEGPFANSPTEQAGARWIEGSTSDPSALRELAEAVDLITWESEHGVSADTLRGLKDSGHDIHPSPKSLKTSQDKYWQKGLMQVARLPVAPFRAVETARDFDMFMEQYAGQVIVKARTGSFDGRGNLGVNPSTTWRDVEEFFTGADGTRAALYAEQKINFVRELAVVGARDVRGNVMVYPVVETKHTRHICDTTITPARVSAATTTRAEIMFRTLMLHTQGAGVTALELFDTGTELLANEYALRVHNSGHWTDYGAETSQFRQHILAITGRALGSTAMTAPVVVMKNILGIKTLDTVPDVRIAAIAPNVHPRGYGKTPRLDRKIGHITVTGESVDEALSLADAAHATLLDRI
jgi:5-(carboxyamino)imidazole ribonucleotide synthase